MAVTADVDPGYRVRPLTREAFDILVDAGVYEGQRVELLDGEVVEMAPQGPEHSDTLSRLGAMLQRRLDAVAPQAYLVRQQAPLAATDTSGPEPDISVVDEKASSPLAHPGTAHLAIEIARTSHRIDLVRKPPLYAAAGVPDYWVVDLVARQVVVHSDVAPATRAMLASYGTVRRLPLDTPLDLLGITIRLSELIPV